MLNVHKLWLVSCLCVIAIVILYFQTEIARLEDSYRRLEYKISQSHVDSRQFFPKTVPNDGEDLVVIYNRVPKTGSTSFVGVAYDLCKKNHFKVLHINITANMHVMSLNNQYKFAQNVTKWQEVKPALYHGHMAFLNFERLGTTSKPVYINLIRRPLDRLVSYYYFLRNGDNFRPHLVRKKHGDKMTFDECVERGQPDCDPNNMWLQVPFFCGHAAQCWKPGNRWALEQAKHNLMNHYLLVGVTEEMLDFITVLEATLPRLFKGATEHYLNSNKSHLRQTSSKIEPTKKTIDTIQKSTVWKMENELYEFAIEHFKFVKRKILLRETNSVDQIFFYEKIRPK
ncbi:heparin sulfate O-sulfotransferase [Leguminivora glycinivorella]|uniref:heparin sulfate O-sulfotransferase n=1 Tax=Leguminivora glycinivorella TaxID=1035111 RepID=UPI00200EB7D3|nr:heparin sulfate O-sulfotransferase [Leguminivora glycinivorella]